MSADFDPSTAGPYTNDDPSRTRALSAAPRSAVGVKPNRDDRWERERLLAATTDEVAEHGYQQTNIAAVAARAGLAEARFHAHFADLEECFLATFDSLVAQAHAHTLSAYDAPHRDWRSCAHAALSTLIETVCMCRAAARVCLLEARTASPESARHYDSTALLLEDAVAQMLGEAPELPKLPPLIVAAISGGVWRVLEAQLRQESTGEPAALTDELLDWVFAYLPRDTKPRVHAVDAGHPC
jgi:AcrR family transcriptional regulator